MKNLTLGRIAEVCGGTYFGKEEERNLEIAEIITDSRKAEAGSLFAAIKGERVDGHSFIPLQMTPKIRLNLSLCRENEEE